MLDNFYRYVVLNAGLLGQGLLVTLQVCVQAFVLGVVLAIAVSLLRVTGRIPRAIGTAYVEFFRATPVLVQLLWVNYVWPDLFGFPTTAMGAGVIALALQTSAYLAETIRAGIEGLPRGQLEAGRAVGMSSLQIVRRIVAPQVALVMAPALISQMAVVIKSSTLVSVIAIPDLMYAALKIVNEWFEPIEVLTSTAFLYFLLIFLISLAANRISDRFRARFGLAV
ncbi:MAG: amino acid ABC transporter permease [Acetobacteraceae bacterium]|nr:amino acid ABC transporter permease [Acetobacteraceae bacterium]